MQQDYPPFFRTASSISSAQQEEERQYKLPIPDREAMQERWRFRETIRRETNDHRLIHVNSNNEGGTITSSTDGVERRNILHVLHDRERKGATYGLTLQHSRPEGRGLMHHYYSKGDRSPSTVFESPVSTTSLYQEQRQRLAQLPPSSHGSNDDDNPAATEEDEEEKQQQQQKTPSQNRPSISFPKTILAEVQAYGEHYSAMKYQSAFLYHLGGDDELDEEGNRPTSSKAVSTISIAFSPDGQTMASTHGDHTVKITSCNTGRLLTALEGHPRTPWTVKYHPTDSSIVASGCLGHQVRLWNWKTKKCLQMVRLEYAIISLSFHPSGKLLAVANGTRLHFWGIRDNENNGGGMQQQQDRQQGNNSSNNRSPLLTEMDQRHMLRCVHFPPNGKTIIIGGVNPATEDARRRNRGGIGGGGMSFYLRLWDFDLARALNPQVEYSGNGMSIARRAISNPRTFVPRALLYNDGGFDVSPDGKTLCACAEYWLPDGVDNAMDLLRQEELLYGADNSDDTTQDDTAQTEDPDVADAETKSAVAAALSKLRGISRNANVGGVAGSPDRAGTNQNPPQTPPAPTLDFVPQTPPILTHTRLDPPSPPGRRFARGLARNREVIQSINTNNDESQSASEDRGFSTPPPPPPPPPPQAPGGPNLRPPHPLSVVSRSGSYPDTKGRYVPHVVTISLDTVPIPEEFEEHLPRGKPYGAVSSSYRPRLGQLLEACPLDPSKASAVTCVKFSPSTEYCLIGYGVREPLIEGGGNFHPVTAVYRVQNMSHVSTMLSGDDDVNIARFHPNTGYGFVYGTKQGRVRILSPRPWNYYDC